MREVFAQIERAYPGWHVWRSDGAAYATLPGRVHGVSRRRSMAPGRMS